MAQRDAQTFAIHWLFLGPHRIVNLAHVRDVAELGGGR